MDVDSLWVVLPVTNVECVDDERHRIMYGLMVPPELLVAGSATYANAITGRRQWIKHATVVVNVENDE